MYDDVTQTWKPRYGYNRIGADKDDWLIEMKSNEDPNVDLFAKKKDDRKERVAKNELQRLRNVARSTKVNPHSISKGLLPDKEFTDKDEVARAAQLAKTSTASLGKFETKLKNEKKPKNSGVKRKFEPNLVDVKSEKEKNLEIVNGLMSKAPKLDVQRAVRSVISKEERQ